MTEKGGTNDTSPVREGSCDFVHVPGPDARLETDPVQTAR